MKKFAFIMVLAALVGCGNAQNKKAEQDVASTGSATVTETVQTQQETNMKTLVTYFSASGVTRNAAKQVADIIGADLFEITPEQLYTDADLDWRDKQSRSTQQETAQYCLSEICTLYPYEYCGKYRLWPQDQE